MSHQKRIEDFGVTIGKLPKGKLNKITDVKGVKVGHSTIDTPENKTGVTVILPSEQNIYSNKMIAASYVLNGFGKTQGLIQIDELGTLESPIALTNTLNVGIVNDAITEYMINQCNKENIPIQSFNPVIGECNDGYLNDIQSRAVKKEHVFQAIADCCEDFVEGDIGGGKGMSCHSLKGGIGSSSRMIELDGESYTLGVLVQSNYGLLEDLTINGKKVGNIIAKKVSTQEVVDKGSIIIVIATDIPVCSRQLKRVCKRACVGITRVGSYIGHGSGDVFIGFSTANVIRNSDEREVVSIKVINENKIDRVFRAVAEACEEAVLNSMITCNEVVGYKGNVRKSLADYVEDVL